MVAIRFTGISIIAITIISRSFSLSEHVSQNRLEIFFEIQRAREVVLMKTQFYKNNQAIRVVGSVCRGPVRFQRETVKGLDGLSHY